MDLRRGGIILLTWFALCLAVSATTGPLGIASAQNCTAENGPFGLGTTIHCEVTNLSATAMATLKMSIVISEPGRSVPWLRAGQLGTDPTNGPEVMDIPGGIEPGEMVPVTFTVLQRLSDRAEPKGLVVAVTVVAAEDAHGSDIGGADAVEARGDVVTAIARAIERCWIVDPGSASANVVLGVRLVVGADGRAKADSIEQTSAKGGDETAIRVAFERARRSILRCAQIANGLPIGDGGRLVELIFDPVTGVRR